MEFSNVIKSRYSVRKFKDTPVEDEKINEILNSALLAPTACNNQPQKIYVCRSAEVLDKLKTVCPCTFDAPVVIVMAYDKTLAAKGRIRPHYEFGETDSAIAGTHMMLTAQNLGLGSCWVGWFRGEDVSKALDLPENIQVTGLMPIGYPAEDAQPGELHSKSRAIEDIVEFL